MESKNVSPAGDKDLALAEKTGAEAAPRAGEALMREASLLLGGSARGFRAAAVDAWEHRGQTAEKLGVSLAIGGVLAVAQGRAGVLRLGAELAGTAMGVSFGADLLGKTGTIKDAVVDTWHSGKNMEANKSGVADTLGSFAFDSALFALGGAAGARIGRIPSVYMDVHHGLDVLAGNKMVAQHAYLQNQMLDYHPLTAFHQERVGKLSLEIAKEMKLPPGRVETSYVAGSFHDIGKLNTPLEILDHTGSSLPPAERAIINQHATDTGVILREHVDYPKRLADVPEVASMHHERLDGKGTPNAVSADKISTETRINSVADVFDVLTHHRSYKDPNAVGEILKVYESGRGTQFDPAATDALMHLRADKALNVMLTEDDYVPSEVLKPFKKVTLGEVLEAVANDYPISTGRVSRSMISTFKTYYGPGHIGFSANHTSFLGPRFST